MVELSLCNLSPLHCVEKKKLHANATNGIYLDSQVAACSFIIVVGVCCACVGTYSSLSKIIQNYT